MLNKKKNKNSWIFLRELCGILTYSITIPHSPAWRNLEDSSSLHSWCRFLLERVIDVSLHKLWLWVMYDLLMVPWRIPECLPFFCLSWTQGKFKRDEWKQKCNISKLRGCSESIAWIEIYSQKCLHYIKGG